MLTKNRQLITRRSSQGIVVPAAEFCVWASPDAMSSGEVSLRPERGRCTGSCCGGSPAGHWERSPSRHQCMSTGAASAIVGVGLVVVVDLALLGAVATGGFAGCGHRCSSLPMSL